MTLAPPQTMRAQESALPKLLDCRALRVETGLSRAGAEAIMRATPVVQFEGLRKVYCKREDALREIERRTFAKEQVPA